MLAGCTSRGLGLLQLHSSTVLGCGCSMVMSKSKKGSQSKVAAPISSKGVAGSITISQASMDVDDDSDASISD